MGLLSVYFVYSALSKVCKMQKLFKLLVYNNKNKIILKQVLSHCINPVENSLKYTDFNFGNFELEVS